MTGKPAAHQVPSVTGQRHSSVRLGYHDVADRILEDYTCGAIGSAAEARAAEAARGTNPAMTGAALDYLKFNGLGLEDDDDG